MIAPGMGGPAVAMTWRLSIIARASRADRWRARMDPGTPGLAVQRQGRLRNAHTRNNAPCLSRNAGRAGDARSTREHEAPRRGAGPPSSRHAAARVRIHVFPERRNAVTTKLQDRPKRRSQANAQNGRFCFCRCAVKRSGRSAKSAALPWPSNRTAIPKKKCALPSSSRYVQQRRTLSCNVSQCLNSQMKS